MFPSSLFPPGTRIDGSGHLVIGGCDAVALAAELGTPLYVFDEAALRGRCAEYRREFANRYPDSLVVYAAKAYINRALARLFAEEGLGLDAVSGGELAIAHSVGFPMEHVYFHGNNKSRRELELALEWGVGRIVVDNLHELSLLEGVASAAGARQKVLLRISPGVDPHTHAHVATGGAQSKFGLPLAQAGVAVERAMASPALELVGLHFHIGSQLFDLSPYREAIDVVLGLAAEMRAERGLALVELSTGGGLAISYCEDAPAPSVAQFAEVITSGLIAGCQQRGLERPRLIVEPGRSITGPAGVALYTVGAIKEVPGGRRYVAVDGGMADNIRPALYGARYQAVVANRASSEPRERVWIAGKYCETGDILIEDIDLPPVAPGDTIAVPAAGAYCLSLASNYNAAPRPAVVLARDGQARVMRRRESYDDLMSCDTM